jgi:hypothetical protein
MSIHSIQTQIVQKLEASQVISAKRYYDEQSTPTQHLLLSIEEVNIRDMMTTYEKIMDALNYSTTSPDSSWVFSGCTRSGVSVFYSVGDGVLSLRIEGLHRGAPIFDQVLALSQLEDYPEWVPLCKKCEILEEIGLNQITVATIRSPIHSPICPPRCHQDGFTLWPF